MNKGDHSDQTRGIVITCIVVPIISTIFASLRIWTRACISRSLAWDDYVAILTLPCCVAYSVCLGIVHYGMGLPKAAMSPEQFHNYSKWSYISGGPYLLSLLGYKMAILLLYLRVFHVSHRFKYATWATMFFVCGYLFCNLFTQYFGCSPVSKFWTHDTPGHCINIIKADLAYGSMNVISDFFIFVLPLPMVWRLNLTRKEKIGVYLVFMSGAIAFTVAIVRFGRGFKSFHPTSQAQLAAEISNRSLLEINTILEINTGLICGCTPALKHLFKHFSPPKRVTEQLQHIGDDFGPIIHFKRPSIFHIGFSLASSLESGTYRSDSTTHDLNVNSSLDESETTLDSCTSQKSSEITIAGSIDPNELSSPVAHDQGGRKSE